MFHTLAIRILVSHSRMVVMLFSLFFCEKDFEFADVAKVSSTLKIKHLN